jgi:hypothetical protein
MTSPEREPGRVPELNLSEGSQPVENLIGIEPEGVLPEEDLPVAELPVAELPVVDSSVLTRRRRLRPVEVYHRARQKIRPREYWNNVHRRAYPEGLATAFAIDVGSVFILPFAQPLITAAISTGTDIMDPKLTAAVLAGAIGGLTATSIWVDKYALARKRFGATTFGTLAIAATGKPTLAALIDHGINYVDVGIFNLVTIKAGLTLNPDLLAKGWIAVPLTLTPWYITINALIANGKIDPVANFIRNKVINPIEGGAQAIRHKLKS